MKKTYAVCFLTGSLLLAGGCAGTPPDMETGRRAAAQGDYDTASAHFEQLAQFGIPAAQMERGDQYLDGEGVQKDLKKALEYYEMAAASGDPRAEKRVLKTKAKLGSMAAKGEARGLSQKQGVTMLKEVALSGDPAAIYELGRSYEKGIGVAQNPKRAADYYREAANLGYPRAYQSLGRLYENGLGVEKNLETARVWYSGAEKYKVNVDKDLKRIQERQTQQN